MARNDLPSPGAANFQQRLRETVMTYLGRTGDPLDRGLTLRDLIEAGIVKLKSGFGAGGTTGTGALPLDPGEAVYLEDLTPPPAPTGFTASASTVNVMFETDAPKFLVGNGHLKTVIYGVAYTTGDPLPTFASAVKVTEFPGNVFSHPLDPGSKWRYWATWVTNDRVEGLPAGGTNGIEATTDLIDDSKIANLSASKIRAGRISVGEYIESASYVPNTSGWRINGDGTAFLENAVVRGTVWANAGQIGGITIASSAVRAGQTGFDTGNGFYLGADGRFSLGNGTQRLTWDGSTLTIKGNLDGASGTFSGNLSASQITSGTLNADVIESRSISKPLTATAYHSRWNSYGTPPSWAVLATNTAVWSDIGTKLVECSTTTYPQAPPHVVGTIGASFHAANSGLLVQVFLDIVLYTEEEDATSTKYWHERYRWQEDIYLPPELRMWQVCIPIAFTKTTIGSTKVKVEVYASKLGSTEVRAGNVTVAATVFNK